MAAEGGYTRTAGAALAQRSIILRPHGRSIEAIRTMKNRLLASAFVLAGAVAPAQAADPHLARNLAATCANCHGTGGRSVYEPLVERPREKLLSMLADFRSGEHEATIMHQIVRGYTDEQLELIATWFSEQR